MKTTVKIVKVRISAIKPYPNNIKVHTERQIEILKKSIEANGYTNFISIDKNNVICAGHGRYEALKQLYGDNKIIECIDLSYLSPAKIKKLRILDNKSGDIALYDSMKLRKELESIFDFNTDLDINKIIMQTAVDDDMIMRIMDKFKNKDDIEDNVPAIKENKAIKPGDIITLGKHRIMCGDASKEKEINKLMNNIKIDMVFTDPPYGINIVRNNTIGGDKRFGKKGFDSVVKAGRYKPIKGDNTTETAKKAIKICLKKSKLCIFWGGNYFTDFLKPVKCWIIWDKETDGKFGDGEIAWSNANKAIRIFKHKWSGMLKASERREKRIHPTQKPIALGEWAFNEFKAEKVILDPFLGSGSTLIAAEKTKRTCLGMEIDAHYCAVIIERYCQYTDNYNIKINGKPVNWKKYKNKSSSKGV